MNSQPNPAERTKFDLDRLAAWADWVLSVRNLAILAILLSIITIVSIILAFSESEVLVSLNINERSGVLYLFSVVLSLLFGFVFIASFVYRIQLIDQHQDSYLRHQSKAKKHRTPKFFSVWILPLISIFLVVTAKIVAPADHMNFPYMIAFTFATSVIVLMIGMELSYLAQDHSGDHRWLVLITASLILDFVSFFVLVVGVDGSYGSATASTTDLDANAKVFYTFMLGTASMVSSYFTIVQARMWDEALS